MERYRDEREREKESKQIEAILVKGTLNLLLLLVLSLRSGLLRRGLGRLGSLVSLGLVNLVEKKEGKKESASSLRVARRRRETETNLREEVEGSLEESVLLGPDVVGGDSLLSSLSLSGADEEERKRRVSTSLAEKPEGTRKRLTSP